MDDTQRIVKCGNLSLHTPGGFFKKRWHGKYLVLYDGSKSGVKRLELFESEIKFKKQNPVKIIPLIDCVRIVTCQRHKTSYTFEVRTSDQFYLLASKSFQDMNDWVNCLRLVAFGQTQAQAQAQAQAQPGVAAALSANVPQAAPAKRVFPSTVTSAPALAPAQDSRPLDVLLERRQLAAPGQMQVSALSNGGAAQLAANQRLQGDKSSERPPAAAGPGRPDSQPQPQPQSQPEAQPRAESESQPQPQVPHVMTASQAAAAASSALAKARQRQPSLLGSCKPLPPDDSPFLKRAPDERDPGEPRDAHLDTLTPTVRGQLIEATRRAGGHKALQMEATLDEEEENMLYCSIEDNPSEHNYRVKVIETELAVRCQLKCYQLTAPKTVSEQYEELGQFRSAGVAGEQRPSPEFRDLLSPIVTFYQLIIGPQELTLLNDYAASHQSAHKFKQQQQQQGLWSWPYQCIRRYGFDKDNCFMFEAGRKCTSGPGQFIVQTPKAYNIYQDVVKFVNELRTVNGHSGLVQAAASGQPAGARQQVVTQIPVTWTPITGNEMGAPALAGAQALPCAQTESAEGPADCRKQFFSQLSRQVDPATVPGATHPLAGAAAGPSQQACCQRRAPPLEVTTTMANPVGANEARRSTSHDSDGHSSSQQLNGRQAPGAAPLSTSSQPQPQPQPNNQKHSISSSSRHSSASDETDESGYEQGDESVESCPTKTTSALAPAKQAPSVGIMSRPAGKHRPTAQGDQKLSLQAGSSICSAGSISSSLSCSSGSSGSSGSPGSPASSSSSNTPSLGNSPGQSVSRRTGETIQQEAGRQEGHQFLIDTRKSMNCPAKGGSLSATSVPPPTDTNKTRAIHSIIAAASDQQTIDFEANLIRDVYSEITKLHAKFAVTSTGSGGDDSMSSDSRESSGAISDRASNGEDEDDEEAEEDEEDEEDEEESNCAEDGCYYMNGDSISDDQDEPMYSNLRTADRPNQLAARRPIGGQPAQQRAPQQHQTIPSARRPSQSSPATTVTPAHQLQRSQQHHPVHGTHANPDMMHYDSCLIAPQSPQAIRPIYPTILNPIPEINEQPANHNQLPSLRVARGSQVRANAGTGGQGQHGESPNSTTRNRVDLSARARLAMNRDDVKRQQQQQQQLQTDNRPQRFASDKSNKLTNHYVINDVQYAKISKNLDQSKIR